MIHNSYDFSLSELSSKTKVDQDQNPSWVNLRSIKDAIRMSSDRVLTDNKKSTHEKASIMKIISNDQDEMQIQTFIDTPMSYNIPAYQEIENIIKQQQDTNTSTSMLSNNINQFKRKANSRQNNVSIYSISEVQKCEIENSQDLGEYQRTQNNHQYKNSCQIYHNRNFSSISGCGKTTGCDNLSEKHHEDKENIGTDNNSSILSSSQYACDNKENQNPYKKVKKTHQITQSIHIEYKSNQENTCLQIVDKELTQFCERVERIKQKMNPLSQRDSNMNRLSYQNEKQRQKSKSTPKKSQKTQSLDLSESQSLRSQSESNQKDQTLKQDPPLRLLTQEHLQQRQVTEKSENDNKMKRGFKRQNKERPESEDLSDNGAKIPSLNNDKTIIIQLKRENQKLIRQMEQQQKEFEQKLGCQKEELLVQQRMRLREVEEENLLIIDGLKQEYEDKIASLNYQIMQRNKDHENERELIGLEYERKIEKKKNKYKLIQEHQNQQIEEFKKQIETYKKQFIEIQQIQQQNDNIFQTNESQPTVRYEDMIKQSQANYLSQRDPKNKMFEENESDEENTPYQSLDNFISIKQKSLFRNDISNIVNPHQVNPNHYYSLSQQDESAMNFSFSDVKTSIDKSAMFDKNLMVLYTENRNILERVPQEDDEDEDLLSRHNKKKSEDNQYFNENLCDNSDEEFQSSKGIGPVSENSRAKIYYDEDDGSENAPEDSGFVSDDMDYQERIVNESSLEADDMLMMTGRSESAIEEEEEVHGLSKCKAINSSYINLKRNNLLISYGKK